MLHKCLDFLLPATCINCFQKTQDSEGLCGQCWKKIDFITPPFCSQCGKPLPFCNQSNDKSDLVCGSCLKTSKIYHQARSVTIYNSICKDLIYKFKYGDQPELARFFAQWFMRVDPSWIMQFDVLAPIPLHYFRQVKRHYNQSIELLKAFQEKWPHHNRDHDLNIIYDLLKRHKYTHYQGRLSAEQRFKNMKGAFVINKKYINTIKGKKVLLIDDIFTTGATIESAARTLIQEGDVSEVSLLTVARA